MAWTKRHGIMLCQPLDEKNLDRNYRGAVQMIAQPKLDGVRAWVRWEDDIPFLISSEGNTYESVPHIQLALQELARITGERLSFDGELYSDTSCFEDIVSIAKRKGENLRDDFTTLAYHIFDYKASKPQVLRLLDLSEWFSRWREQAREEYQPFLQEVKSKAVDRAQITEQLETYINQGYEGIILRNPSAPYVEGRPWTILKWKPSKHDEYKIVVVKEAISEDGKPLGRVGSLECRDTFGNHFCVGAGIGVDVAKATKMWEQKDKLIGKYVTVYYQNLTDKGVPRFGKFCYTLEVEDNQ